MHQKDYCKPFFHVKVNIDNYMQHLNVNHELFDYHVTKSWVGYHKDNETPSIPAHFHNESNLSFVYYVHTNESSDKFCVSQLKNTMNTTVDYSRLHMRKIRYSVTIVIIVISIILHLSKGQS